MKSDTDIYGCCYLTNSEYYDSIDYKRKLSKVRLKLDNLDNKLIKLIRVRTNLVKEVLKLKEHKKDIIDKKRISMITTRALKIILLAPTAIEKTTQ